MSFFFPCGRRCHAKKELAVAVADNFPAIGMLHSRIHLQLLPSDEKQLQLQTSERARIALDDFG
jgi:hypothetical protein